LFSLQNTDAEPRWHGWLIPWVAGLTLLRAIGHVLVKADSNATPKHRDAINALWVSWKNDRSANWVFWDFIENERNNVLKEFMFGFQTEPYAEPDEYDVDPLVYEKIELFREAIYWWRIQLRKLEIEIRS
jgi:hypothetical protein